MKEKIGIVDLNFMTYTYHSTPQPSMYVMLISGWHKAKGNNVLFLDEFPNPSFFDKIYLVKDRRGVAHIPRWLGYPNVAPVGNYWDKEGIKSYYNPSWEDTPPDNTIYWNWIENWIARYPKYNKDRLEHFYYTPVKIRRKDVNYWVEGEKLLILDNDMYEWDPKFEQMIQQNITQSRFAYPIPIDGRWDIVLDFLSGRQLNRQYLYLDMDFQNYTEEDFREAAKVWNKYKPGRMPRLLLNVEYHSDEEWTEAIPRIYKALEIFRMDCSKILRVQPFGMDSFSHPRILQELKRWSGTITGGYIKNSLFDYILFDSIRGTEKLKEFLMDPYTYTKRRRGGSNKLTEVLAFIEDKPELFHIITQSYNKGAY